VGQIEGKDLSKNNPLEYVRESAEAVLCRPGNCNDASFAHLSILGVPVVPPMSGEWQGCTWALAFTIPFKLSISA
jgi:hypothetical protein